MKALAGVLLLALLASPAAASGTGGDTAAAEAMAKRFLQFRQSAPFRALLMRTVRQADERLPPACDDRKPVGRELVAVPEPVLFKPGRADPVAGRWIERVAVARCGTTVQHNVFFVASEDGLASLAAVPGRTRAGIALQRRATTAVATTDRLDGKACDRRIVVDTRVASAPVSEGAAWDETWTVDACGKRRRWRVVFTPRPGRKTGIEVWPAETAQAAGCDNAFALRIFAAWYHKTLVTGLPSELSMADGRCIQEKVIEQIRHVAGRPVGYKVGLTSKAAQARFGVSEPVRGVVTADMLLEDNARVPVDFAARPAIEPDLLVTVRDAGINDAATPVDVARHLRNVRPFIELPDLSVTPGAHLTAATITAINVGARKGVAGSPVPVPADEGEAKAFADALATMTVTMTDRSGATLSREKGEAILGHPLEAVIWLARDLAAQGRALRAGDVISLGAFAAPREPDAGQRYTVSYDGLPSGPMYVSVEIQ